MLGADALAHGRIAIHFAAGEFSIASVALGAMRLSR